MNRFGVFELKSTPSDSPLPTTNTGTPNAQSQNSVMRQLSFEDEQNGSPVIAVTPTKPFANLFLKKERKHASDPVVQLSCKPFAKFFGIKSDSSSIKADKGDFESTIVETQSKTSFAESDNQSCVDGEFACSQNSLEGECNSDRAIIEPGPKLDILQRKKSNSHGSFFKITEKFKVLQETQTSFCSEILDLSSEFSKALTLSTNKNIRDPDLNTISPQTVAALFHNTENQNYLIVDCRYRYEYEGGHIKGALNIESPEVLEQIFFTYKHLLYNPQYLEDLKTDINLTLSKIDTYMNASIPTSKKLDETSEKAKQLPLVIFHCEFSQKRGPRAFRTIRNRDRELNVKNWPHLDFPEIYVLEGGYSNFYPQFPEFCKGDYVRMVEKKFKKEYAEARETEKKLWKKSLGTPILME